MPYKKHSSTKAVAAVVTSNKVCLKEKVCLDIKILCNNKITSLLGKL